MGGLGVKDKSIEEWINLSSTQFLTESAFTVPGGAGDTTVNYANASPLSKKSLLNKLDMISKGKAIYHLLRFKKIVFEGSFSYILP